MEHFLTLTEDMLQQMLSQAAYVGAHKALTMSGVPVKEYYTRAELNRKFGRGKITRMIANHTITPHKIEDNGRAVYSLTELLTKNLI